MDADNSSSLIDIETTYDFGFLFSGGGGYAWRNGFCADAEVLYATYDLDQVSVTRATGLGVATSSRDAEGDLLILALMANGAYDFDLGISWRPYLLAGAGVAQVSLNDVTAGGAIVDDEAFVMAFQAGLGVNYALTDNCPLSWATGSSRPSSPSWMMPRGTRSIPKLRPTICCSARATDFDPGLAGAYIPPHELS